MKKATKKSKQRKKSQEKPKSKKKQSTSEVDDRDESQNAGEESTANTDRNNNTAERKSSQNRSRPKSIEKKSTKQGPKSSRKCSSKSKSQAVRVKTSKPKSRVSPKTSKSRSRKMVTSLSKKSMQNSSTKQSGQAKNTTITNVFVLASPKDAEAQKMIMSMMANINLNPEVSQPSQPPTQPSTAVQCDQTSGQSVPSSASPVKCQPTTSAITSTAPPSSVPYVTDQGQLEELYDAVYELHTKIKTVQESYQQIIRSLVNLQQRRPVTQTADKATPNSVNKQSLLPAANLSQVSTPTDEHSGQTNSRASKSPNRNPAKEANEERLSRSLPAFMNADTRDQAFRQLFEDVSVLKVAMSAFEACFDSAGFIDMAAYERSTRVSVANRNAWMAEIASLDAITGAVLAEYNKEVLDMFRLSKVESTVKTAK